MPDLTRRYRRLTLSNVYLSFAGYKLPRDPTHRAIAELAPGDRLQVQPISDRWELCNYTGDVVDTLARKFEAPPDMRYIGTRVLAVTTRSRDRADPEFQQRLKRDTWGSTNPRTRLRAPQIGRAVAKRAPRRCPADEGIQAAFGHSHLLIQSVGHLGRKRRHQVPSQGCRHTGERVDAGGVCRHAPDLKGTTLVVHVLEAASQAFHRPDGYRAGRLLVEVSGRLTSHDSECALEAGRQRYSSSTRKIASSGFSSAD